MSYTDQGTPPSQGNMITMPMQKLIEMVAKLHGGQAPGQSPAGIGPMQSPAGIGPMQSNITPGTFQTPPGALTGGGGMPVGASSPQGSPPHIPPASGTAPPPTSPQSSQSAPPASGGDQRVFPQAQMGQVLGAPQLPQGGYGGLQQAPFSGGDPSMASPTQDYGSFMKSFPMPKPPSWEDAVGVAEELRQNAGMRGPGQGDPLGTSPALVGDIMDKMNSQYKIQGDLHAGLWAGQLQAAHMHNSDLAMQERMQHDRAQEAYQNRSLTQRGDIAGDKSQLAHDKFNATESDREKNQKLARDKLDETIRAHNDATTDRERAITARAVQDAQRNLLTSLGIEANLAQNPNATPEDVTTAQGKVRAFQQGGTPPAEKAAPSGGDKPPMEGAKKAPDGNWYVQKDGKWNRVD